MIFDSGHFKRLGLGAEAAAEIANELIEDRGYLVYGRAAADGDMSDFKTIQTYTDTHVAFLIGHKLLGNLPPKAQKPVMPIKSNLELENAQLQKNLDQLKGVVAAAEARLAALVPKMPGEE